MPIGIASAIGRTEGAPGTWRLTVEGDDVPGRWPIMDREFRPVEG
jgi:hypothetical protein